MNLIFTTFLVFTLANVTVFAESLDSCEAMHLDAQEICGTTSTIPEESDSLEQQCRIKDEQCIFACFAAEKKLQEQLNEAPTLQIEKDFFEARKYKSLCASSTYKAATVQ